MDLVELRFEQRDFTETSQAETPAFPRHCTTTLADRIEAIKLALPESHEKYTDKYFLSSNLILKAEGKDPWIRTQAFVRKGPGVLKGVEEAIGAIDKFTNIRKNGGAIYAMSEGSSYNQLDTVMVIEARIQDIMELETMALGILSGETLGASEGVESVDITQVRKNVEQLRAIIGPNRKLIYMGARHAHYRDDAAISQAAFDGGADGCSTDAGAATEGKRGVGTIPHALENILAYYYGRENAVLESLLAYDRVMPKDAPRTALCDYNNKEITDSLAVAGALYETQSDNLWTRVDTCGENMMEGAYASPEALPAGHPLKAAFEKVPQEERRFWFGNGVTVSGVYALRSALDAEGYTKMKILLSSGFSNPVKTRAFVHACELLEVNLFDGIGAGELWSPCRPFTMDIVNVAESREELDAHPFSKIGREYRPNEHLKPVMENGLFLGN